jgi:adenylate cyclase
MARLIIHSPDGRHEVDLDNYTTIGRLSLNRVRIDDPLVSKEHCLILIDQKGKCVIRDLGSRNGTFVSGRLVERDTVLKNEDSITLGATSCIFISQETTEEAPETMDRTGTVLSARPISGIRQDRFLPESEIKDVRILRADYEKLRVWHELQQDIGHELDLGHMFGRILDRTFELLECDRAVILMADDKGDMVLRAFKMRQECDRLIVSSTIVKCVQHEKMGIISADALTDERFDTSESILIQHIRSSMAVPLLYERELLGVMVIDSSAFVRAYSEKDLQLFTNVAQQAAQFIKIAQMAKKIEKEAVTRERFQRLMSPDLAEMVVSGKLTVEKGGQGRTATVLFADIRGFTSLCENMQADEVVEMLNDYFELIVDVGFCYEGTVDKFMGDMAMMLWGAPIDHDDDPARAVQAALDMQAALAEYNHKRTGQGQPEIKVGIGINTGQLVAGYIGASRTMSYSVIGDTVNIASRLCSAAKPGQVIISQATYTQLSKRFEVAELEPFSVKGKTKPVKVYQVLGRKTPSRPSGTPLGEIA